MEHYFSENPNIKSNRKNIEYNIGEKKFKFTTDNGVFSKSKVDEGTSIMLRVFIENNKNIEKKDLSFLDLGCGYGVVSVIIKSFFKNFKMTLSDVNERALELSEENLKKNEIEEYKIIKSESFLNIQEKFDIILSNPPIRRGKAMIFQMYEESYKHLRKNGEFYCVIQTKHGAKSTQKKLEEIFGNCKTLEIECGYRIFCSKKY